VSGVPCLGSVFDLVVDQGPPVHLTSPCSAIPELPSGAFAGLVPTDYHPLQRSLELAVCTDQDAGAPTLQVWTTDSVVGGAGTFNCVAHFVHPRGGGFSSEQKDGPMCTLTITQLGAVGEAVVGSLDTVVSQSMAGPAHILHGTFNLCRTADAPGLPPLGGPCAASFVNVSLDEQPAIAFTSICYPRWDPTGSTYAVGWLEHPSSPPPDLDVMGCANTGFASAGIEIQTFNGIDVVSPKGMSVCYRDPTGRVWDSMSGGSMPKFGLTLWEVGAVGEFIDGTFTATGIIGPELDPVHTVSGSFHVCREPDQ
jgi:hypothetical protein